VCQCCRPGIKFHDRAENGVRYGTAQIYNPEKGHDEDLREVGKSLNQCFLKIIGHGFRTAGKMMGQAELLGTTNKGHAELRGGPLLPTDRKNQLRQTFPEVSTLQPVRAEPSNENFPGSLTRGLGHQPRVGSCLAQLFGTTHKRSFFFSRMVSSDSVFRRRGAETMRNWGRVGASLFRRQDDGGA